MGCKKIGGQRPKNRILTYSVKNKGSNHIKTYPKEMLKVDLFGTDVKKITDYDLDIPSGKACGLFAKEIKKLSDGLDNEPGVERYYPEFGKVKWIERDDGYQQMMIKYSEIDAVDIVIGDGDDIKIVHHKKLSEEGKSDEGVNIKNMIKMN